MPRFADAVVPSGRLAGLREALTKVRAGATSAEVKAVIDGFATGETAGPGRRDAVAHRRLVRP